MTLRGIWLMVDRRRVGFRRAGYLLVVCSLLSILWTPGVGAQPPDPTPADERLADVIEFDKAARLPRTEILIYQVQPGDTLWDIAARYDLDVDTIRWSNPAVAENPDYLRLGQELVILPVKGAYVTVQPGDTVEKLATRWGVAPADIINFPLNNLKAGEALTPGTRLVIPHGRREVVLLPPGPPPAGYLYAWPIRGTITQGYQPRHRAIDLGAPYGAKVYAARAGRCISATWSAAGYGYLVILSHSDGSQTYYSHLKGAWVKPGQWIERGDLVGEVGSTGNSTGPHVHFEIRIGGVPQNPLDYLPPKP